MGGAFHDDAVGVDDGLALGGEAGLDELAEESEERLDTAEGFDPEADLGGRRQGDGGGFEEEVDAEGGGLRGGEGTDVSLTPGPSPIALPACRERGEQHRLAWMETESALTPGPSPISLPPWPRERGNKIGLAGMETVGLKVFGGIKGGLGVRGKGGIRGVRKGGLECAFWSGKGVFGCALWGGKGGLEDTLCGPAADGEAEGGALAAAIAGEDGELAGSDKLLEESLDAAAAEARSFLEGGLVGDPLAALVGIAGDDEEDHEVRASSAGVVEDGGQVLNSQGWLSVW
jgi:hypothetical protein